MYIYGKNVVYEKLLNNSKINKLYLSKKFNTSKAQAGNLVMTENAYFSQLAQKDCFNDLDVEKYEIV